MSPILRTLQLHRATIRRKGFASTRCEQESFQRKRDKSNQELKDLCSNTERLDSKVTLNFYQRHAKVECDLRKRIAPLLKLLDR